MSWKEFKVSGDKKSSRRESAFNETLTVSNEDEYKYLEKAVLGTGSDVFADLPSSDEDEDTVPLKKQKLDGEAGDDKRAPAWVDEDDDRTLNQVLTQQNRREKTDESGSKKFQNVLEKKFEELMGVPKWARQKAKKPKKQGKDESPESKFLAECGEFLKKPTNLHKDYLQISRVKSLNHETRSEGPVISVVRFHPKSMVAMVGGSSGHVSLFQVDGKHNTKLQTLQFQKFPIFCGSFLKNGEEFIIGSKYYRHLYCHNMMSGSSVKLDESKITEATKGTKFAVSPRDDLFAVCGNSGKIYLFTVKTKEYVDTLQMNCDVTAVTFNGDGSVLFSHGADGEVYAWDTGSRSCFRKFPDEGCLRGTSLAASGNNQFLACGSNSGVVNVYGSDAMDTQAVRPLKSIYNLVTPVTGMAFNSNGEILAISSAQKESALKFVHTSSMTVFSNFPPFQSKLKKPMCVDFSPNSGFFGVGDTNGTAHLYRLKHYRDY